MKTTTRVVVIGGGVVGCSVLYHLTKLGWTDVMLLERSELTAGSTWHAAGGFHTINGDTNMAALQGYTIKLYKELEEITGQSCGLHHSGGITMADSQDRRENAADLREALNAIYLTRPATEWEAILAEVAAPAGRIHEAAGQPQRRHPFGIARLGRQMEAAPDKIEADRRQIDLDERLDRRSVDVREQIGARHTGDDQPREQPPVDIAVQDMADRRYAGGEGFGGMDTCRRAAGRHAHGQQQGAGNDPIGHAQGAVDELGACTDKREELASNASIIRRPWV